MAVFLRYGDFVWLEKSPENTRNHAVNGDGVLVSEVFSNRTGLRVGDIYRARVDASLVELPVIGIVRDYRTDGGVVFIHGINSRNGFMIPAGVVSVFI